MKAATRSTTSSDDETPSPLLSPWPGEVDVKASQAGPRREDRLGETADQAMVAHQTRAA